MKQKQNIGIIVAVVLVVLLLVLFYVNACGGSTTPPPATAEAPASPGASAAEIKATVLSNVNLRSGPGTNYSVVGSVPANSEVTVIGRNEDSSWLRIKSDVAEQVW